MALKTLVKAGQISNLSDARYCAGMGVEMLGFHIDPQSPLYVAPDKFKQITDWVAGVKLVGETSARDATVIKTLLDEYPLDYLQVQDVPAGELPGLPLPVICQVTKGHPIPQDPTGAIHYYLVDWKDFNDLKADLQDLPVLVNEVPDAARVMQLIDGDEVKGIAVNGSWEENPGFKDYDQLADILEALELDG